jgi:membrane protease YdiL (CAAX protease family)
MLSSRTVIGLIITATVAAIFFRGSADPWAEAYPWWRVFAVLIGLGIVLLYLLARREGISILDLGNFSRRDWLRDSLIGLGLFIPFLLLGMGGIMTIVALFRYDLPAGVENLPTWATLFILFIWPIIWGVTEDFTYLGYSLPRIEALTGGRKWLAVIVIWLFLSSQHVLVPFTSLAWQVVAGWFIGLLPLTVFYCWLYWRLGRLLPIIVAHVLADVASVLIPLFLWQQ